MKKLYTPIALIVSLCTISQLHPADARSLDERLYHAVNFNLEDTVRDLLLQGANLKTFASQIAAAALATENIAILGMLLDAGMDPNTVLNQDTILHRAAETNNREAVEMLLVFGADPTRINGVGKTPEELTTDPEIKALLNPSLSSK